MRQKFEKVNLWFWPMLLLSVAVVMAIQGIANGFPDTDTYFLIETGRYIVGNKEVPTINPFVIHEGFGIIIQQWLFDVLIYGVYNFGGWTGVFLYSMFIMAVTAVVMYQFFGLYSQNRKLKIILLAICIAVCCSFYVARPTSISFLMCLSVVAVMEVYRQKGKWQVLLLLPVISLLTINVHAAMWPMLFVLIVPFIFFDHLPNAHDDGFCKGVAIYIKEWFAKWKWVLIAMAGMMAAGFVNPNGLRGIGYLFLSYGTANGMNITELQATPMASYFGVFILGGFALLVAYICKHKRNVDMKVVYMAAGTLILSMLHLRNAWYLFFGVTPLFLELLGNINWRRNAEKSKTSIISLIAKFYGICLVVVLAFISFSSTSVKIEDEPPCPVKAVEYLNQFDKEDVVLYTEFNNGAFMEMNGYKVYIDARPELYQKKINGKEDLCTEFLDVLSGECDYTAFFEKYGFTHMIVEDGSVLSGFLRAYDGYTAVVDGNGYVVYERIDMPDAVTANGGDSN